MVPQKQHPYKIVLTGPESSGKTQMAHALSAALGCPWTPEFARYYLAHLGRPYERRDLEKIGRGQKAWETWFGRQGHSFVILDTDWTVLHMWESVRFGRPENETWHWKSGYGVPEPGGLYLLCAPDFPWEPDPLRENPDDRDELFGRYEDLLRQEGLTFAVLRGPHSGRLEHAISLIQKVFGPL